MFMQVFIRNISNIETYKRIMQCDLYLGNDCRRESARDDEIPDDRSQTCGTEEGTVTKQGSYLGLRFGYLKIGVMCATMLAPVFTTTFQKLSDTSTYPLIFEPWRNLINSINSDLTQITRGTTLPFNRSKTYVDIFTGEYSDRVSDLFKIEPSKLRDLLSLCKFPCKMEAYATRLRMAGTTFYYAL